ncbi:MAG: hypothetical protein AAB799_00955, partial [Patescibacteria group bacterium]
MYPQHYCKKSAISIAENALKTKNSASLLTQAELDMRGGGDTVGNCREDYPATLRSRLWRGLRGCMLDGS